MRQTSDWLKKQNFGIEKEDGPQDRPRSLSKKFFRQAAASFSELEKFRKLVAACRKVFFDKLSIARFSPVGNSLLILLGRAVQKMAVHIEARAVAGAVPAFFVRIPLQLAAQMGAFD